MEEIMRIGAIRKAGGDDADKEPPDREKGGRGEAAAGNPEERTDEGENGKLAF